MISPAAYESNGSPVASRHVEDRRNHVRRLHATYCGFQEDGKGGGFELWNLLHDIPGHPEGSTVTQATLDESIWG